MEKWSDENVYLNSVLSKLQINISKYCVIEIDTNLYKMPKMLDYESTLRI